MPFLRSASAVIFFVLAAMFAGTPGAQAQSFTFTVCNKTSQPAFVAISHMVSVSDSRFEVEGWWTVQANTCGNIGTFPEGWFYYYAEQTGGNWAGDFPLCVQYPGPFSTVHTQSITCPVDDLKQFNQKQVTGVGAVTWTLNP